MANTTGMAGDPTIYLHPPGEPGPTADGSTMTVDEYCKATGTTREKLSKERFKCYVGNLNYWIKLGFVVRNEQLWLERHDVTINMYNRFLM